MTREVVGDRPHQGRRLRVTHDDRGNWAWMSFYRLTTDKTRPPTKVLWKTRLQPRLLLQDGITALGTVSRSRGCHRGDSSMVAGTLVPMWLHSTAGEPRA